MTMNVGIYTKDFIPEDQSKARTYECLNCNLVSEYNYCIDCNHCICTECLKQIKKCPIDNRIIDENTSFRFNFIGNNLLEGLKINCIFKNNGCTWIGTKKQLEEIHYQKCLYRDNRRKLVDMNTMNGFSTFENYNNFNNNNIINNNIEENLNKKMMLRKKPKKKNIEYDEDLDGDSSCSDFSKMYLGNDESSVVEVENSFDEYDKDKFNNFNKKLFNKNNFNNKNEEIIKLSNDDNNLMSYIKNSGNNNGIKIISINKRDNNEFINKKTDKKIIQIKNDFKMNDIKNNNKKKLDVVKIYSNDFYEENNKIQNDLIEIKNDKNYMKPRKDIISLEEDNEIIEINKNKELKKDNSNQNKVFVFK